MIRANFCAVHKEKPGSSAACEAATDSGNTMIILDSVPYPRDLVNVGLDNQSIEMSINRKGRLLVSAEISCSKNV